MGQFLLIALAFVLTILWGGFVASTLWGWFLVPLGVKAISYWHAIGVISLMQTFLGVRGLWTPEEKAAIKSFFGAMLVPAISLVLGWLAKHGL